MDIHCTLDFTVLVDVVKHTLYFFKKKMVKIPLPFKRGKKKKNNEKKVFFPSPLFVLPTARRRGYRSGGVVPMALIFAMTGFRYL